MPGTAAQPSSASSPGGSTVELAARAHDCCLALLFIVLQKFPKKIATARDRENMQDIGEAFRLAIGLVLAADRDLLEIIALSLRVSITATLIACVIGMMLGALLAMSRFPGRSVTVVLVNALMGLPPVVVGLLVYLHLSRSGPLGWLGLLYTPTAMIIAQTIIITPIIVALSLQIIEGLNEEYAEQFHSMSVPRTTAVGALLWDVRYALVTVALAGFGRAIAEVGAVIIVGGNIDHLTRVMTTAIALETSKGNLSLALALGLVLMALAIGTNALVMGLRVSKQRFAYA